MHPAFIKKNFTAMYPLNKFGPFIFYDSDSRIFISLRLRCKNNPKSNYVLFCSFGIPFSKITLSRHFLGSLFIVYGMKFPASSGRRTQTNSNQQKFSSTRHQRKAPVQGFRPFRFLQQVTKVKIWDIQCVQTQVTELLSFAGLGNSIEFLKHTH